MHVDALAVRMAKARRQFLDGKPLLPRKPELVVGTGAIRYGTAEHFIDTIAAQITVALDVLSSKTTIHIEIRAADEWNT